MFVYNGTAAPSHDELINIYRAALHARLAGGEVTPLIFPYHALGGIALFVYLCIPHASRPWLQAARWPLAAAIVAFDLKIMAEARTMYVGTGFGVGLVASLGIMWTLTWLVWNDPQAEAKRVERIRNGTRGGGGEEASEGATAGQSLVGNGKAVKAGARVKQRKAQNGLVGDVQLQEGPAKKGEGSTIVKYYWQSYPVDSVRARVDWVTDLLLNLRGTGWNWEIHTNPSLPASIKAGLGEAIDLSAMKLQTRAGRKRFPSRAPLLLATLPRFLIGYLLLDLMKTFLPYDPYFLVGPNAFAMPAPFAALPPLYLLAYRQAATLVAIVVALETIFRATTLLGCFVLGPGVLGVRGEPWHYPTTWGAGLDSIWAQGLAGLWGGWWHQTFRVAFGAPTAFLVRHRILAPRSPTTRVISLVVAFASSGFLHAAGSYTQLPTTVPLNPFLFFLLQAVGILLQTSFCAAFRPALDRLPLAMRERANLAFAFTWLFCTGPLLVDDFARGGLWLLQVVPVSPVRGLGFGDDAHGWWCWGSVKDMVRWHTGPHWWQSGLAF